MAKFRFQDLDIWKDAIKIADKLFDIADQIEKRKLFRLADQLRAACISISNNIAEGSGSVSDKDFANFLNIAKRSAFENANMLIVLQMRGLIDQARLTTLLDELEYLSRRIASFQKTLRRT